MQPFFRRLITLCLLASALLLLPISKGSSANASQDFVRTTDEKAGVDLDLPRHGLSAPRDAKWGRRWSAAGGKITIETLAFPSDQTLAGLYQKLRSIRGRRLDKDRLEPQSSVLAGSDADGSRFLIELRQDGPQVRGVSIVYATGHDAGIQSMAEHIAQSLTMHADQGSAPAQAVEGPRDCGAEKAALQPLAASVDIKIGGKGAAGAGEPIEVAWKRGGGNLPLDLPVYIILTMPEWVRFEGQYILPIPSGARVPSGVGYGADKMRVFIPLSARNTPQQGSFKIHAYRAGPLQIGYAVVAKPACGETVMAEAAVQPIEITPGTAEIVIQDFFSTEKPSSVTVSNDGRYRLERFAASYRVFNGSGVKIVDRAGRDANFSPAARFVAAYVSGNTETGGAIELIDLITGKPVPDLMLQGPTLAWALGDALLIEGTMGHPELKIRRALVDPTYTKPEGQGEAREEIGVAQLLTSGRGSAAWHTYRLKLLLDPLLLVTEKYVYPENTTYGISAFELASGTEMFQWRLSEEPWPDTESKREEVAAKGRRALHDFLAPYGGFDYQPPDGWDTGEPLMLSHYSRSVDDHVDELKKKAGSRGAPKPKFDLAHQREKLVAHQSGNRATAGQPGGLSNPIMRGVFDWRTSVAGRGAYSDPRTLTNFAEQLERFGLCVAPGCGDKASLAVPVPLVTNSDFLQWNYQYGTQKTEFAVPPEQIETELKNDVPLAKRFLDVEPNRICYQDDPDAADENATIVKFRAVPDAKGHTDVHGVWTWSVGNRKFWLVQAVCSHAGIMNSPVILFVSARGGEGSAVLLGGGAQTGAGLHEEFSATQSQEALRIRPYLVEDRWLMIAAPAGNAAAIIDLETPDKPIYVKKMRDVYTTAQLFRSADGSRLVQLNTDGRFYIYKTADGERLVSGRWIDDELVLVTDNGYYDGTYEGAHFVHLGFVGVEQIYSLAQFESVLRRPDIISSALRGEVRDGPRPALSEPPSAAMKISQAQNGPAIDLDLRARAGLKTVRLFDDGQLMSQQTVSGHEAKLTIDPEQRPRGRWISAQSEDEKGLLSAPVSLPNPAATSDGRTLQAVLVGIDKYQEPRLRLNYARSDALRLAAALREKRGGYYASVSVATLLDEAASSEAILKALAAAVDNARPHDTVLFSFAGHGLRADDGHYYITSSGFRSSDMTGTGLAWSKIAEIVARAKARVIVVLDSCHSGATGSEGVAANDQAADGLLKGSHAPVLVFAAAKGRQYSYEDQAGRPPQWGGGVFTYALVKALSGDWRKADTNGNGVLEVSEIYRAVKSTVVGATKGSQTPWLVRQDLIGDFALF